MKRGVLPSQTLRDFMQGECIAGIPNKFINPASLDLPLDEEAFRLECVFLPRKGEAVRSMLPEVGAIPHDMKNPLEVGVPYLVHLKGQLALPEGIYGYANPKSSTGRLNLFVRTVTDGVEMYDAVTPPGWTGELWMLIRADSFPVLLTPGQAVTQMRFFDGKGFLDDLELKLAAQKGLLFRHDGTRYTKEETLAQRHADSLFLSVGVPDGLIGWECRGTNKVLDFGKIDCYKPEQFFEPVEAKGGKIKLRKGSFYILTTAEYVRVPPEYSAELRATDQRLTDSRIHAAGFIDAGWGWGKAGECLGRPITLEVTVNEDNVLFRHGQKVARIRYEWMREPPERAYDEVESNYKVQSAAKLSKHFKQAA